MNVSTNWLRDHLDLDVSNTDRLADLLTFAGVEVEGITPRGAGVENVVVAQIQSSEPHPNADRLSVCQVDDGSGTPRQIVCGAKNYKTGDKVPLALPGATLPGGFKIKTGKLRGVESQGMMCSGRELKISDDHEGLLILDTDSPTGTPLSEVFESDIVFELEITPNRPDLLSHLGIARELSALTKSPLKDRAHHADSGVPQQNAPAAEISLETPEACPFYTARRIRGVKVGPSPRWLTRKLESIGLRPINNVVDITNYVLFEMGQPLHAFDADKLDGGIRVRTATEGETFLALDGNEYVLQPDDLVIADQSRAVAIGGVMGGEDTGVAEGTTEILLESAVFSPAHIRRTSRRLDLGSDSSYRFERGIDPAQTAGASELATQLILEIAGGEADESLLVTGNPPPPPTPVRFDAARAGRLLGANLSPADMGDILSGLGLENEGPEKDLWKIPSYRLDLERSIDLVEEVARVHGIEKIPSRQQAIFSEPGTEDARYDACLLLRQRLASLGYYDCLTIKLISEAQLSDDLPALRLGKKTQPVTLKNPLSQDHTTLRPSLIPGLLALAERNVRQGSDSLRFFELGTVFVRPEKSPRVLEPQHLGILLAGAMTGPTWDGQPRQADIHDLTGLLETLFETGGETLRVRPAKSENLLLAADVLSGKTVIGRLGQVWPERARAMDWEAPLFVAEIDLTRVLKTGPETAPVQDLPRFPAVTRDIALEVPSDLPSADLATFFRSRSEALLTGFALFDVFEDPSGEKLPAGRKSLAYSLTYRSPERTLTSEEVDAAHEKIIAALRKREDIRIR